MEINKLYQLFLESTGITTDSRKITQGNIYFALKGENFDGNKFAEKAIIDGAKYAVIDDIHYKKNENFILVSNVLTTLQELANYHRKQINLKKLIAITGSNGKTTTKELVNAVLETTYKTHYTKGNLNNHIGIPITLLQMNIETEIAIIEMGANHQCEIASYCQYVEPNIGIITNIGKAHLEGFGGIEGVKKGKGELFDYINKTNGLVFLNTNSEILQSLINEKNIQHVQKYGTNENKNLGITLLNENPFIELQLNDCKIKSNLYGKYNLENILCAISIAKYFKVTDENIKLAIENYFPNNSRSQLIEKNGFKLVLDAYNANPTSMQHAIESFREENTANKIVILGDMFELGEFSAIEHQKIADLCSKQNFFSTILVGNHFCNTNKQNNILYFEDTLSAKNYIITQDLSNKEILLKGSRGMKMETIFE